MQPLIVVAAILRQQERVLITRRPAHKPHGGLWELPGGKLRSNESPQCALRRELCEELGIEASVEWIFDVVYHRYDWGPVLILAYECRWLEGTLQHLEVEDHRWIHPGESGRYPMLEADQPIFERLACRKPVCGNIATLDSMLKTRP
jgi:8-oxo-dGTP diphosphatase